MTELIHVIPHPGSGLGLRIWWNLQAGPKKKSKRDGSENDKSRQVIEEQMWVGVLRSLLDVPKWNHILQLHI